MTDEVDEKQKVLYKDIFNLITPYIKPNDPDSLLMTSGTLLAVAMQLYTAMYKDNKTIETILENAKESLPQLRDSLHQELHTTTLH